MNLTGTDWIAMHTHSHTHVPMKPMSIAFSAMKISAMLEFQSLPIKSTETKMENKRRDATVDLPSFMPQFSMVRDFRKPELINR